MLFLPLVVLFFYWIFVIFSVVTSERGERGKMRPWLLAGILPTTFMIVPVWVFLVLGAAGTVQFNVESPRAMSGWHLWVDSFFPLLIFSGVATLILLAMVIAATVRRELRPTLPAKIAQLGLMLAVFVGIVTSPPLA